MIDQADGLSRCRRCGMRLGEIINALRHQQEIANAPPPTLEEALMERTGFPIWLGTLLTTVFVWRASPKVLFGRKVSLSASTRSTSFRS
ncbi:MAG: hypothetical protein WBH50_24285 [Fuerstiella sp.]